MKKARELDRCQSSTFVVSGPIESLPRREWPNENEDCGQSINSRHVPPFVRLTLL